MDPKWVVEKPRNKYCLFEGCGVGIDLEGCGAPGRDDLGSLAYSSKSYINTSRWDVDTLSWAERSNTKVLVIDVGFHVDHRWGKYPCDANSTELSEMNILKGRVLEIFSGIVIFYGYPRSWDFEVLPERVILFNVYGLVKDDASFARYLNATIY
jgi:hypothetical protein